MSSKDSITYHPGEVALQERTGRRDFAEALAKRITPYITDEASELLFASNFIVLSGLAGGMPVASILSGPNGFIEASRERVAINAALRASDPLSAGLEVGSDLGLIVINLAKSVRYRINGHITRLGDKIVVEASQCYRNCPQYINQRESRHVPGSGTGAITDVSATLSGEAAEIVRKADTYFIASHGSGQSGGEHRLGADASHRGGNPGFVKLSDDGRMLVVPDYPGNFMFNTMGNLFSYPYCGLLFIDFDSGDLVQISGMAEIDFSSPDVEAVPGAQRLLRIRVQRVFHTRQALPISWTLIKPAPDLRRFVDQSLILKSGDIRGQTNASAGFRNLAVSRIVEEADGIRSVYLTACDGEPLKSYKPGQYLPLRLNIPTEKRPVVRNYSLSTYDEDPAHYRLGIRRIDETSDGPAGVGSNYMHDLVAGDVLEVAEPSGSFTLDPDGTEPIALISAGVGITPVLSMLTAAVKSKSRRPIWFIHGARSGAEQAYASEIKRLTYEHPAITTHIRYSAPSGRDFPGRDHDSTGRIDIDLLRDLAPREAQYFICGPDDFMKTLKDDLLSDGVAPDQINVEAFTTASHEQLGVIGSKVRFGEDGEEFVWDGTHGNLLELAEANGMSPLFSCRVGTCQTCAHRLLSGEVAYPAGVSKHVPDAQVLLCSAAPISDIVIQDVL